MRCRVIDQVARSLAAQGITQIALFGAGRHTRPILRQPWCVHGIRVAMILDDAPAIAGMGNIPICKSAETTLPDSIGAIVISSEHYEDQLHARAMQQYGTLDIPIVRIYRPDDGPDISTGLSERLIRDHGIDRSDAIWLLENRGERHDATLPMLPADRTELHLRRYELARDLLRSNGGQSVVDMASGTGYGAQMLADQPETSYVGVDIDAHAVDYATRRFGDVHRRFVCASVTSTGLDHDHADLVASFETIEHVEDTAGLIAEYARVLRQTGTLVVSTPNRLGPTPYHVHDFDYASLTAALDPHFEIQDLIGQLPNNTVYDPTLPPGMWLIDIHKMDADGVGADGRRPDYLIMIARPRDAKRDSDCD